MEYDDEVECMGGSSIDPPCGISPQDIIGFVDRPLPISHRINEVIPTSAVSQIDKLPILSKPQIMEGVTGTENSPDLIEKLQEE